VDALRILSLWFRRSGELSNTELTKSNMTRTTVRLPDRLLANIESRAITESRSVSQTIRMALSREFDSPLDPEASSKPKTRRLALK
jgi:hypothetical protein